MGFSKFLESRKAKALELIKALENDYTYVSILGSDVSSSTILADKWRAAISEGRDTECGFVLKLTKGKAFYEYSLNDIQNTEEIVNKIKKELVLDQILEKREINSNPVADEKLVKSFKRDDDFDSFADTDLLEYAKKNTQNLVGDEGVLNATSIFITQDISKLFVSKNKVLDQHYTWVNGMMMVVYKENDRVVQARVGACSNLIKDVVEELPTKKAELLKKAHILAVAKPMVPGVYDIITDPSITGLIAHEAFGHGVEMDQFVKDRALAKEYMNKYVASPIVNMKDGALSGFSVASFFFDDDGVLAHDTQIIKDGILVSGLSDLVSASELKTEPTGNGRRESFKRKAYSRMTNTFIEKGTDKLEDMIKSIKHGYMLFDTNNGMEDPKNWAIQCVCEYGIEIVDGKLTENYVAPVVMSGYVPDLLKSISMISDDFKLEGAGSCGKGYKEWVRVSDGGPALKAKVKLA